MNYLGVYRSNYPRSVTGICDAPCVSKGKMLLCGPKIVSEGRLIAMVHGRIRNRSALQRQLGLPNGASDAQLALHAYRVWRTDFPARIEGPAAVCVMDAENDRMVLARDRMGEQPIFYARVEDGGVVFSDHPDSLLKSNSARALVDADGLRELFGIILTSVLMLLVVAFVVIYLLRTLFRQKTLEEMRMDFTHNITHELKTPIAVAYAANDALENFGAADDGVRRAKYLGVIRSQLTALSEMVERILTMSREEREDFTLRRERIPLAGMLGALAEKFRMQAAKPARVTVDVSPEGLTAFADRFHLSHALDNLVDNALKYSGEEVHIRISAGRDGGRVVLRVADDGVGIPRAAQAHIFDKFYRVPTGDIHNVKGFGLGLYYVGLIAAKHGGSVAVESTEGRGTTFTLILPDDGR